MRLCGNYIQQKKNCSIFKYTTFLDTCLHNCITHQQNSHSVFTLFPQILLLGLRMMVLAVCIFTVAHQLASTKTQHRSGWTTGSLGETPVQKGRFEFFSEFFRCSHQDLDLWRSLDILCLGTWTWTIISTLIWPWDLCPILSLFIGIVNPRTWRWRELISLIITISWFDLLLIIHRWVNCLKHILCFRARPVVHIGSTLQVTPNNIDRDKIKEQCGKRTWYAIKLKW